MAKLNSKTTSTAAPKPKTPVKSVITTVARDTVTFEGEKAHSRDARSDLFLLATTSFYGEETFYEKGQDRSARFKQLVAQVAAEDPAWLRQFLPWLRHTGNIRTAAIVGAVEAARVLAKPGQTGQMEVGAARAIMRDTLLRADEPAEALAYWLATYGRKIPAPIRRGIADVAAARYNQRNFIKWNGTGAVQMADVIELTHPAPTSPSQDALFKFILDQRRRPTEVPESLTMLRSRQELLALSEEKKAALLSAAGAPAELDAAGMTWEQVSSWGKFTAATWEALIPTMGYMALLRNLRNFQEAGISQKAIDYVAAKLADPEEVHKSRQLPFRFLSAYIEATGTAWAQPLETALQLATANIPSLPGSTLVLVDTSSSMSSVGYSAKSKITPMKAGALFGVALAAKGEKVDLHGYADGVFTHNIGKGASVLRETERFVNRCGEVGHGTETAKSLKATFKDHDRVVIVTDGQTFGQRSYGYVGLVTDQVPKEVPIYAFNMMGYAPAMMETSSTRHEMGGLTDHTFRTIAMVEAGQRGQWPWETAE